MIAPKGDKRNYGSRLWAATAPAALVALFLDNLQRYRDGQPLRGEVDFVRGY